MKGTLVVDTPEDYQTWLKERAELAGGAQSAPKAENKPPEPAASPSPSG
jgi:heme/copper-type cytochrome/quinol oxidase subunit 2